MWEGFLTSSQYGCEDWGSNPGAAVYFVWSAGQWRDYLSSFKVGPALNRYKKESGEGKHKGYAKAKDAGLQPKSHFLTEGL